jgi:hypothetical protein
MQDDDERRTAGATSATGSTAIVPNPFVRSPVWELGTGVPHLRLDPWDAVANPPAFPLILTGVHGCGAAQTTAHLVERAPERRWRPVHVLARPFHPLVPVLADAIVAAAEDHDRDTGSELAPSLQADIALAQQHGEPDGGVEDALVSLLRSLTDDGWGLFVCVENVHATTRVESDALLRLLAHLSEQTAAARAMVTASGVQCVATDAATRRAWIEVPLSATRDETANLLHEGDRSGRAFTDEAVELVHRYAGGVAEVVLLHAAAAWDASHGPSIPVGAVEQSGREAASRWTAGLRARWSGRLTLGQRRYLRSMYATAGSEWAFVEDVHGHLRDATRFAQVDAALDTTLAALVREGLVVVQDGAARIAVRGLATIL